MLHQGWLLSTAVLCLVLQSLGEGFSKHHVIVTEPGSAPELPDGGGCSPWLRNVEVSDLLAALASFDFVALHALPAWKATNFRIGEADAFVKVPFLPEHPWFNRGGSAFAIDSYGMELLQSEDEMERTGGTRSSQLLSGLLCMQLFAILRRAISAAERGAAQLRKAISLGDDIAKRFLSSSKWSELWDTRWARCIFGTMLVLGELVCATPDASKSCREHAAAASASRMHSSLTSNASTSHVSVGRSHGLLELSVRGLPFLKRFVQRQVEGRVHPLGNVYLRNLRFELAGKAGQVRSLKLESGAVAHVLGMAWGKGYDDHSGNTRVLEFLMFFDTADGCADMFTVGSCGSLPRAALLAWRCDYARAGRPVTSTVGAAASHYGTELVLQCPLPSARNLQVQGGVPRHSANAFQVTLVAQSDASWSLPPLPISIRPRQEPRWRLVGCSAPLYIKQKRHLVLVRQWLAYHRDIGFDHFFIYDIDGSLGEALQHMIEDGFVTYSAHWPRQLSKTCAALLNEHPRGHVCTQTQAEAHCVWRTRGLAQWTMLLHSFDAYISAEAPATTLRLGIRPILASLDSVHHSFAALTVLRFDFSCDPEAGCPELSLQEKSLVVTKYKWRQRVPQFLRGSVHRGFDLSGDSPFDHGGAVLMNPDNVLAMQTHWARGRPGTMHAALPPDILRMNHYVELLGHGGRCAKQAGEGDPPCDLLDDSMLWTRELQWTMTGSSQALQPSRTAVRRAKGRGMKLGTAPPCRSLKELGNRLLVIVPGHGEHRRTPVLADNLRLLRNEADIEMRCLVFIYRSEDHVLRDPDGEIARCQVVRRPGIFLEFLSDVSVRPAVEGTDFVLLMLDDISLKSSHPTSAAQLMHLMRRNRLDVASPALVGSHRSYEGMRPVPLRRGAVGRLTNFIEIQMPLFTRSAFEVFRAMIYPRISSTWGHAALYHGTFLRACGREPRMGIVDTMHMMHTGAWLTSTMDERRINRQLRALQVFFRLKFNVTPVEERMFLGKLWP